jgi:hypothetical protein
MFSYHPAAMPPPPPPLYAYYTDQINLGDSVTVSWTGSQSHTDDWQDWDWIAGFQVGACNATSYAGQDTCYAADEWAWMSEQGTDGTSASGSWDFTFDGPGTYEFRASYCGCDECNDVTGDIASCDGYG